jgi:transposase InsO family protein
MAPAIVSAPIRRQGSARQSAPPYAGLDCVRHYDLGVGYAVAVATASLINPWLQKYEIPDNSLGAPHPIEWPSDNGPCYTARETCEFARSLGLLVCTTPTYSPQSNGVAEAFVKTFKRDYVYVNQLPSADEVIAQLPGWFADYNEIHPHKGLGMRSPREYLRAVS